MEKHKNLSNRVIGVRILQHNGQYQVRCQGRLAPGESPRIISPSCHESMDEALSEAKASLENFRDCNAWPEFPKTR